MSVRKLPNGKWVADVTLGKRLDGSRDRQQSEYKTKKEALKEERRLLVLKEVKRGRSYGGELFSDFVEDYFWPQKTKLRNTTVAGYRRDLKLRLIPAFGEMAIEDISRYEIQKMINSCSSKKVATNARETLSSILSLAVEMGVIDRNPASYRYQYPPSSDVPADNQGDWLTTWEEIIEILEYIAKVAPDSDVHRACVLGLCFGLRKGEIVGFESEDAYLEEYYIYIGESHTSGFGGVSIHDPKTENGFRSIPIIKYAQPYLEKWCQEGGYIVKGRDGDAINPTTLKTHFNKFFTTHQFEDGRDLPHLTAASCRHSFGTACANIGVEITKLASWMGHADTSVTKKYYIKQKLKNLHTSASMIDDLVGGIITP